MSTSASNNNLQETVTPVSNAPEEQEIDLIELAGKIWKQRMLIIKACGVAIVLGLIVAFSLPKEFTTTVQLVPESTESSSKMGNLGELAAINLNSVSGSNAISPDLYPDVVQSTPFMLELFPIEVKDIEGKLQTTVYEYMEEYQRKVWWGYLFGAPFRALGWVRGLIAGEPEEDNGVLNPFFLTRDQERALKGLRERVAAMVDKKTQVITVSVKMQDPLISAQLTNVVVEQLQEYITTYRTQKAKQDLEFTESVFEEARESYYRAQRAYAAFEDANKNIISASYRTEQERLKNEMTLAFNLYNTLAQKLGQDKLRVQERMPVYTIIEPATVPLKASSPKKLLILIGFIFLAGCGAVGYILFKDAFNFSGTKETI
ncbi:MAG: Wzz/FepE/Etk N-terminal domain-containing protein [Tannerellaceae bacterium]|nr:Wzz/FepE/Etk N-terminal domain-containing protein [Tannerellaceae bacterium]